MPVVLNSFPDDEILARLSLPAVGETTPPDRCRALALAIAHRGLGAVAPNPLVGAVIVDAANRFIGAGAHERVGDAHGEINALEMARKVAPERIAGGTLYVTLEPCAHAGRTPACAPALVESRLARVVYGIQDPNPRVDGRGAALLSSKGIACKQVPEWKDACGELAEVFLTNQNLRRPFVALKAATSLDAAIGNVGDRRTFLTGSRARTYGHFLRVKYDAIAIGVETFLADDPELTPRDSKIGSRIPQRFIVDPRARSADAIVRHLPKVLNAAPENVAWISAKGAWSRGDTREAADKLRAAGASIIEIDSQEGRFSPEELLTAIKGRGASSVLLEGGAGLYAPFLAAGCVDRLHLFQCAKLLGDASSISMTKGAGALLAHGSGPVRITPLDEDWVVETRLGYQTVMGKHS